MTAHSITVLTNLFVVIIFNRLTTCAGVLAGVTATCFTQPFDMLKTRMQLKPLVYRNLWSSAKKVIAVRNTNVV
jgi:Mitochondrial carrier protein